MTISKPLLPAESLQLGMRSGSAAASPPIVDAFKARDRAEAPSTGLVVWANFEPKKPLPIPKTTSIDDFVSLLERDEAMATRLAEARRAIGAQIHADQPQSLAALRVAAGLSQAQLAQRIGTSQSHIACIERGKTDPGTDVIERIAGALGANSGRVYSAIVATRAAMEAQR